MHFILCAKIQYNQETFWCHRDRSYAERAAGVAFKNLRNEPISSFVFNKYFKNEPIFGRAPELISYGATHPGQHRPNNEDTFLIAQELQAAVLADGMGGEKCGE